MAGERMEKKNKNQKKEYTEIVEEKNTVKADGGEEVYSDLVNYFADEYIETLDGDSRKALRNIQGRAFSGMVKYISIHCNFKPILSDIAALDDIWKSYTALCYKYNQPPYISEFAILLNIHRDTLYSWMNGETCKEYSEKLSATRSDIVKKWADECKQARLKGAAAGNVGMIFLCKAVDGLVETAPAPTYNPVQVQNNIEIASKMGLLLSDNNTPGKSEENG